MEYIFKSQFQSLAEITGLPFKRKGSRMISATYINGSPCSKVDKTYAVLKNRGVYIKEQGGDDLSLPEWLELYGDVAKLNVKPNESWVEPEKKERIFVNPVHWESTIPSNYSGNLFTFLSKVFNPIKVREVFHLYNVGERNQTETIFWYTNGLSQVCHDSIVPYLKSGKRDKTRGGYRKFQVDMGYSAKCVFGAHLTAGKPDSDICVVESEKSAIIMAIVEKQGRIWVATGGSQKIFLAKPEWKRYGDFDSEGFKWNGIEWWKGLKVDDGWGVDDWVLSDYL